MFKYTNSRLVTPYELCFNYFYHPPGIPDFWGDIYGLFQANALYNSSGVGI